MCRAFMKITTVNKIAINACFNVYKTWHLRGLHLVFWQVVRRAISLADTEISLYIDI